MSESPKISTERGDLKVKLIACFAFISLGIPDAVLGVAWPSIAKSIGQPIHTLGWLIACGFTGYLIASVSANGWAKRIGLGTVLIASSSCMVAVLLGISIASAWGWLIVLAFFSGIGGGSIDVAINAFASTRFSARWLNWMHACWGIGAAMGPLLMTALLANGVQWRVGYIVLACGLACMTCALFATRESWQESSRHDDPNSPAIGIATALRNPRVAWLCLLYWVYTGVESTCGYLLFSFLNIERDYSIAVAGAVTSAYWGALTIGRIVFGQVLMHAPKPLVLRTMGLVAVVASLMLAIKTPWSLDLLGACILGFALAPIFPTWISLTPDYVGKSYSSTSIGLQMASAAIGVATCPLIVGQLSGLTSFEAMPRCLLAASVALVIIQDLPVRRLMRETGSR